MISVAAFRHTGKPPREPVLQRGQIPDAHFRGGRQQISKTLLCIEAC